MQPETLYSLPAEDGSGTKCLIFLFATHLCRSAKIGTEFFASTGLLFFQIESSVFVFTNSQSFKSPASNAAYLKHTTASTLHRCPYRWKTERYNGSLLLKVCFSKAALVLMNHKQMIALPALQIVFVKTLFSLVRSITAYHSICIKCCNA